MHKLLVYAWNLPGSYSKMMSSARFVLVVNDAAESDLGSGVASAKFIISSVSRKLYLYISIPTYSENIISQSSESP